MAAEHSIAFRDIEPNHYYKLSEMPQTISTAVGLSAGVLQDLRELYFTPCQLIQINCANNHCVARFQRPQADGGTRFSVHSSHLQNGTMTRFTEVIPAPDAAGTAGAAGASGGAKRKLRKSKKTRKSKASRKSRKIRK